MTFPEGQLSSCHVLPQKIFGANQSPRTFLGKWKGSEAFLRLDSLTPHHWHQERDSRNLSLHKGHVFLEALMNFAHALIVAPRPSSAMPLMQAMGIPGGFGDPAGFSAKFRDLGSLGQFGVSKGFCANRHLVPKHQLPHSKIMSTLSSRCR